MNPLNRYISFFIFVLINSVFLYKYMVRISDYALLVSFMYALFLLLLFCFADKLPDNNNYKGFFFVGLILIVIIQFIFLFKIPVESLNTDRWSVITSFLDELFKGNFPYLSKSHLNNPPGPFPGYFLFSLPFYLIGEIGLFSLTGIFLFFYFLKLEKLSNKSLFIALLFLTSSSVIWYELIVRSTIFVNMAIAILYFSILYKSQFHSSKFLIILGLIGGFVLSTRGIMLYIFIVMFTYVFIKNKKWSKFALASFFTLVGFGVSIIPFMIWDWQLFQSYNPITLQASFIPKIYLILFALLAFWFGYSSKNLQVLMGNIGILLFVIVSVSFLINVANSSLYFVIAENGFDISYFFFSIPFLLIAFLRIDQNLKSKIS